MTILQDTPDHLWVRNVRLSFSNILVPTANRMYPDNPPLYSCTFLLEPTAVEVGELRQVALDVAKGAWADRAEIMMGVINGDKSKRCYGKGEESIVQTTGKVTGGYEGKIYIKANLNPDRGKPQLYGQDGNELPPTAPVNTMFVSGNYVDAVIKIYAQLAKGGGIRAQLVGVQYVSEGEHFAADAMDAGSVFQPVPGAPDPTAPVPGAPVAPIAGVVVDPLS